MDPLTTRYMGEILQKFGGGITVTVPPPTAEMAFGSFIGDIVEIGLIVIVAITMGSVAGEKASGVTAFIVTKPVSRKSYVLAKYWVHVVGVALGIAASSALAYLYTWSVIGPAPVHRAALATVAIVLYAAFSVSVTFTLSMVAKGGLAAGGASLCIILLVGLVGSLLKHTVIGPWFPSTLMGNAGLLLSDAIDIRTSSILSLILKPGSVTVLLSALLLLGGFEKFKKQDLQ